VASLSLKGNLVLEVQMRRLDNCNQFITTVWPNVSQCQWNTLLPK